VWIADSCYPDDGGDTFLRKSVRIKATRRNIPEDGILHKMGMFENRMLGKIF
jgi:hypothetical protein